MIKKIFKEYWPLMVVPGIGLLILIGAFFGIKNNVYEPAEDEYIECIQNNGDECKLKYFLKVKGHPYVLDRLDKIDKELEK